MNDPFKSLLNTVKDALLEIGMSVDMEDRGCAEDAARTYDRARRTIQKALQEASEEDRETFHLLFGFNTDFNQTSWSTPYDYILALLPEDPEISLQQLRDRIPRFLETIETLKHSPSAMNETLVFRYTRQCEPSLLSAFRMLIAHNSGTPGWYYEGRQAITSFHFSLEGSGFRVMSRNQEFEYDVLLDGMWLHCLHPMRQRRQEIKLVYEKGRAAEEIKLALVKELKDQSWEPA